MPNTKKNPESASSPAKATRVVGIGASAGGLEALELFLAQTPVDSGMAFIVVQHLDPTHKALLSELLQRVTAMPVHEVRQRMRIQPNTVYVIPPNSELSVAQGLLKLARPMEPRGLRLPINVLFSSLAKALNERSIAVVLSGMGSDGTQGLQAIKAVGGLTLVQSPETAQFDSMPLSAIAADCVDIVDAPAQLPARLFAYVQRLDHAPREPDPALDSALDPALDSESDSNPVDAAPKKSADSELMRVIGLLHQRTHHDFSRYKPSTLHRRIERRMAIHGLATMSAYADFLEHNPHEIDLLFKELLIGVTSFFRDPGVWQYLADTTLPELLARRIAYLGASAKLRAWVVGCSTGEEAYSLAMIFNEVQLRSPEFAGLSLQIFASDLNPDAITVARRGRYPSTISAEVSPERLARFFTDQGSHYTVHQNIRDMVLFAQHDVLLDPPFTRLDLLACRNLLIYFDAKLQRKLMPLFHYSLFPTGVMLLGSSETAGQTNYLFSPLQSKFRLYLRQDHVSRSGPEFLSTPLPHLTRPTKEQSVTPVHISSHDPSSLQAAADHVLLQVYAPAAVVVSSAGDIVYISGLTGKYLEPAAGKANWNFHAMVREGLRTPLFNALRQASQQSEPLHLHGLRIPGDGPGAVDRMVDVTVQALREPAALQGMTMIVFRDVAPLPKGRRRKPKGAMGEAWQAEMQQYRDEIQALREEALASTEELQSANEELQSTNEELQSTNEELTTSREEMQSMNEELQTINNELQSKLDDLALAQSDMQNVLNSIEIAILFLDRKLHVRRYTERAARIISLRESDVGRPLSDLSSSLEYPSMFEDAQETLRTLVFCEKQVRSNDGRWFTARIMPYRRMDNMIDGVVITLLDITETKKLEQALRQQSAN